MSSTDRSQSLEEGDRLVQQGDLEGAYEAYQRAAEKGDAAGTASAYAGLVAEIRGDRAEAEKAYRQADEQGDGYGAFRLGLLLSNRGQWDEAQAAWRRADERGYDDPPFDTVALLRGSAPAATVAAMSGPPRSINRSAFANPVLIGATTVLVLLVAVFLAYNSNSGLPFVPTKELKVDIANASEIVVGNEVREGGFQVGLLSDMRPVRFPNGLVGAQLTLQLSKKNGNVPLDSRVSIKPLSLLGLKYIDIARGQSRRSFADGAVLSISHTNVPVQIDDITNTFNAKTRVAIQQDLSGYGTVLAGRGSALNDTLYRLPTLLQHLQPVAHYLSQPSTELTRLFGGLNEFMGAVAPVAHTNVLLFRDMATTFKAISSDPNALEQTIARSPSTEDVGITSLRIQQPFLADLTTFGRFMTPATAALKQALPILNPALEAGTRTLARSPILNAKLQQLMTALKQLAQSPGTNMALNGLVNTTQTLNPMLRYLAPFQTVCDYWNYWWTYLGEHISEQTQYGLAQRVLLNFGDTTQPNNVGQQGAVEPANGQNGGPEFLHAPNYGAAIDNQGNADCETGQRGFPKKLNYFDPKGRNLDTDAHTPGDQGPTFAGRTKVPAGETFTRNPATGPQLTYNPANP